MEQNTIETQNSKFTEFKNIRKQYEDYRKNLNSQFLKSVIDELKVKYGDFAVVFIGYTPSFNDGEPCKHSSDYSYPMRLVESKWGKYWDNDDRESAEDYTELFELDDETETSINTHLENDEDFKAVLYHLDDLISEVYETNYEVKIKVKGDSVLIEHEDYYCDY